MFNTAVLATVAPASYRPQHEADEPTYLSDRVACSPWEGLYLDQASSSSAAK